MTESTSTINTPTIKDSGEKLFQPRNILITGAAGFIGSNVTLQFVKKYHKEYKIIAFDKLDYCSSLMNLDEIRQYPNFKFIQGNICSPDFVRHVFTSENIDTVLHFAAQTHVDNSFGNSIQFTQNNILGTHVLLEAAKVQKVQRFIHVSTDEVYGEAGSEGNEGESHTETSILQPTNPYAATKAGAEFLVQAYHKSFGLPTIITRGNNVFGPRQYPEKLIPKCITLFLRGKPCYIHGNGNNKRSFIFVDDVVSAFDTILHKGITGELYNIGIATERSNISVAKDILKIFGLQEKEKELIQYVPDRPFNDFRYAIHSEKLERLGWSPKVSWEEGLQKTVAWYREILSNGDAKQWWDDDIESVLVPHPRKETKI